MTITVPIGPDYLLGVALMDEDGAHVGCRLV